MGLNELVELVCSRTGLRRQEVRSVLDAFAVEVKEALESGEHVSIPLFGTFFTVPITPRPLFGGERVSEGRRSIRFREARSSIKAKKERTR